MQQNQQYQRKYLDREMPLHYNIFRYNDPDIGRFTQPDPILLKNWLNLYRYVKNSLIYIDLPELIGFNIKPGKNSKDHLFDTKISIKII